MTDSIKAKANTSSPVLLSSSIQEMLDYFKGNKWFVNDYWPENLPRVSKLLSDLTKYVAPQASVFEPGCGNGYISFLASRLGYKVTATDGWEPEDRVELFRRGGIDSFQSNLNLLEPWPNLPDNSFDAILFGEVFEHLLNHPVGLLGQLFRVLKPGGVLLLTTPNPSTLTNAMRVLLDKHSLWGTDEFAGKPKIVNGHITDEGDIHYREYRADELRKFLTMAGFQIVSSEYIGTGSTSGESTAKGLVKSALKTFGLQDSRLFAGCNYIVSTKRQ